jgi:hypothetical protein
VQIWDRQWHSNTWNALNSPFEEKEVCILGFHVELSFYIGKCNESWLYKTCLGMEALKT